VGNIWSQYLKRESEDINLVFLGIPTLNKNLMDGIVRFVGKDDVTMYDENEIVADGIVNVLEHNVYVWGDHDQNKRAT